MKTQTAHELIMHAWWDETLIYSDKFFDTTATISEIENEEAIPLMGELQMIRESFEQAEYPQFVSYARQHLLRSMAEVMLSFQAFFSGEADTARIYMQTAQSELFRLQNEVDRLGLSRPGVEPHIQ